MSSRSNGVMNEEFTLLMIAWVDSSAACSMARIRVLTASRSECSTASRLISSCAPSTRWPADVEKSSKKLFSRGVRRKPTVRLRSSRMWPLMMVEAQASRHTTGWTPQRRLAATGCGLAVRSDRWAVLSGTDAEEQVYLVLVQRPVAGCRRHHEFTDQLDLGLQVIICEVVIVSFCGHGSNLPAANCRLNTRRGCRPPVPRRWWSEDMARCDVGPGAPHGTWPLGAA